MPFRVIEPPKPILAWADAKMHLKLDSDEEKVYVEGLIAAAQSWFDGAGTWLGHSFGLQVVDVILDGWTDEPLPFQPIAEIVSVTYTDAQGTEQTMPDTDYRLLYSGAVYAETWPNLGTGPERVVIRVKAGYLPRTMTPEGGGDPVEVSTVPMAAVQALKLIVGHWYVNRETVVIGTITAEVPMAAEYLLAPFRSWRGVCS